MLNKEMLERLASKVSECIPEQFKHCKSDFQKQAQEVLEKVLAECHIVTQSEFDTHLKLLETLRQQVRELEQRLHELEEKKKHP